MYSICVFYEKLNIAEFVCVGVWNSLGSQVADENLDRFNIKC